MELDRSQVAHVWSTAWLLSLGYRRVVKSSGELSGEQGAAMDRTGQQHEGTRGGEGESTNRPADGAAHGTRLCRCWCGAFWLAGLGPTSARLVRVPACETPLPLEERKPPRPPRCWPPVTQQNRPPALPLSPSTLAVVVVSFSPLLILSLFSAPVVLRRGRSVPACCAAIGFLHHPRISNTYPYTLLHARPNTPPPPCSPSSAPSSSP